VYCFQDNGGAKYYTNAPGPGRTKVRLPLGGGKGNKVKFNPGRQNETYEPAISYASQIFSVDSDIVRAVIKAESNYNPRAVSPKGAMGLMQLMPGTAREMGVADPFDPEANIHGGVRYLSQLLELLNGDIPLVLAAYNAGPLRVVGKNRIPQIPETRNYVEKVLKYYNYLKGRNAL